MNAYSGFIHYNPKLERTQMSFNVWTMEQAHPCHGILLSNEKEPTINTCIILARTPRINAEWERTNSKRSPTACVPLYTIVKQTKLQKWRMYSCVSRLKEEVGSWKGTGGTKKGNMRHPHGHENALQPGCINVRIQAAILSYSSERHCHWGKPSKGISLYYFPQQHTNL